MILHNSLNSEKYIKIYFGGMQERHTFTKKKIIAFLFKSQTFNEEILNKHGTKNAKNVVDRALWEEIIFKQGDNTF